MLEQQGARPEIIRGAMDMSCDTCLENQPRPKMAHPSSIHVDRDFNDVVGIDGAYWTNSKGKQFMFVHVIDEGTLYHLGSRSGRTVEEMIQTFENTWQQWAGPCRTVYLDPAGEFVSETWAQRLQAENIRVSMTAAEGHWQIGRVEIHGKIIKRMLDHMDRDQAISDEAEFDLCLRQAFAAKNSLSRIAGFTPEQALLGKSKPLPASITGDDDASSHALAEDPSPEGIRFRQSLIRREEARRAFVKADNDSSFRRALLRRSRPGDIQ